MRLLPKKGGESAFWLKMEVCSGVTAEFDKGKKK